MSGHLCESRRDSVRHRETGSDNRVARETTYRAPDWHLGGIRDCGNVRSAPCLLYDRFRKVFTSVAAQQIAWSGALRVDEGLGPNKAFSGAISGNHGLRYPYRAEILDTQAVLNDTHVKCPISIGHSLRVVVLNRMRCDRPQSAQHGHSRHRLASSKADAPPTTWDRILGVQLAPAVLILRDTAVVAGWQ